MDRVWIVYPGKEEVITSGISSSKLSEAIDILGDKPFWIHLRSIDEETEEIIKKKLNINELSIEDCRIEERSKVEVFENYIFSLVIYFDEGISRKKKLCVFWGKNFILTVGSRRLFESAKKEISLEENPFDKGVEWIFWILSSLIADKYRKVAEILEEQADEAEARVFKEQSPQLLEDISDLSFEILTLRRTVKQVNEVYRSFLSLSSKFVSAENVHYFRDLLDEITMLQDRAEALHEFIQNVLSVFSSLVSFRLNDIMKTLTIIMTILAPLTLITGFYGMNVVGLPLASSGWGIVIISVVMLLISFGFLFYFRRKKWI
jgi:magnesium transporter